MNQQEAKILHEIKTGLEVLSESLRGRGGLYDRVEALEKRRQELDKAWYTGLGIISAISAAAGFVGTIAAKFLLR